jgi:hypothetical protein
MRGVTCVPTARPVAAPAWLMALSRGQRGPSSPGTATHALARRAGLVRGEMDCGHMRSHRIES